VSSRQPFNICDSIAFFNVCFGNSVFERAFCRRIKLKSIQGTIVLFSPFMKTRLVSIGYRKSLLQQLNCLLYFSIPNLLLHLDILKSAHVFLRDENT
jgi:hypothetical protein